MNLRRKTRRQFLADTTIAIPAAFALAGVILPALPAAATTPIARASELPDPAFVLPPLTYATDALEPHIDTETMAIHHGRHHAAYVANLNKAVAETPEIQGKDLVQLLQSLDSIPESVRQSVRNNGGGHWNHTFFWDLMTPGGAAAPQGPLAAAITKSFGSVDRLQDQMNAAGLAQFGSGWVWLVKDKDGNLAIRTTPNQDTPVSSGETPILGNDVWEHAYYLRYQNRRADYLAAWWNVVNWDKAAAHFEAE